MITAGINEKTGGATNRDDSPTRDLRIWAYETQLQQNDSKDVACDRSLSR
jgi:hypothetical protein